MFVKSNQNFVQRQESVYGNYRVCVSWVVGLKVDARGIRGDEVLCFVEDAFERKKKRRLSNEERYHDFHLLFEKKKKKS